MSRHERLDTALSLLELVSSAHDSPNDAEASLGPSLRQEQWIVNMGKDEMRQDDMRSDELRCDEKTGDKII